MKRGHLRLTQCLPSLPQDDGRLFGFVRITTGDAMSKRAKFTLITWVGESVSGLQRAKISTDKTLVKEIVQVGDACTETAVANLPMGRVHWCGALMVPLGELGTLLSTGSS